MIQKHKAYGSSKASQNLMRSFLKRRRNRVKLGNHTAHGKNKKGGVHKAPPTVWNLLQDDLSLHRQSGNLFMYEGLNGGGLLVGCRLKFSHFVGSRLKFSIFVGCR